MSRILTRSILTPGYCTDKRHYHILKYYDSVVSTSWRHQKYSYLISCWDVEIEIPPHFRKSNQHARVSRQGQRLSPRRWRNVPLAPETLIEGMHPRFVALWLVPIAICLAQFPPQPQSITTIHSKIHHGVNISFKEPGLCETTPGVKSYSGYVELPADIEDSIPYRSSIFFWFFESRESPETAPLTIWLNGGPGSSSLFGALQENGPCFVGDDSNSTFLNPYSWNNKANMLYIDQPVQTGFSFSSFKNATLDLLANKLEFINSSDDIPRQNLTFLVGTLPTQDDTAAPNSTVHAAHGMWHFLQTWLAEFPGYKTENDKVSLWTESYGGKLGPIFMDFFAEQNKKIADGLIPQKHAIPIHLDVLGIINGCVDALYVDPAFPMMAYNNTYGIQAFNESHFHWAIDYFHEYCVAEIEKCQQLAAEHDPTRNGHDEEVNEACITAGICAHKMIGPYGDDGRNSWFDIAHQALDPFPPSNIHGYLSQQWVQTALGVPVNFTGAALSVALNFRKTGDPARGGLIADIASLLDNGVKVALMYGDRDFACNWIGGEKTSLVIPWSGKKEFESAGYEPIFVGDGGVVGQVRQYGNLSFSRVYQAGHQVPSYQPEASYEIFMRALSGKDISNGQLEVTEEYSTHGPSSTWHIKNELPKQPPNRCYTLDMHRTCSEEEISWLKDGTAIVKEYVVVGREKLTDLVDTVQVDRQKILING